MLAVNEHTPKVAHDLYKGGRVVYFYDRHRTIVLLDGRRVAEELLPPRTIVIDRHLFPCASQRRLDQSCRVRGLLQELRPEESV